MVWQKNQRNKEEQNRTSASQEIQEVEKIRRQMWVKALLWNKAKAGQELHKIKLLSHLSSWNP